MEWGVAYTLVVHTWIAHHHGESNAKQSGSHHHPTHHYCSNWIDNRRGEWINYHIFLVWSSSFLTSKLESWVHRLFLLVGARQSSVCHNIFVRGTGVRLAKGGCQNPRRGVSFTLVWGKWLWQEESTYHRQWNCNLSRCSPRQLQKSSTEGCRTRRSEGHSFPFLCWRWQRIKCPKQEVISNVRSRSKKSLLLHTLTRHHFETSRLGYYKGTAM